MLTLMASAEKVLCLKTKAKLVTLTMTAPQPMVPPKASANAPGIPIKPNTAT